MKSFASKTSLRHRQLPYLATCILACAQIACGSETSTAPETEHNELAGDAGPARAEESSAHDDADNPDAVGPEASPEAQAARDEAANPGSAAVTRFDGMWQGTTSQDTSVSFKILNRFVAHAEVAYALDGDDCEADAASFRFSAMTPTRMGAFTLMNTTDSAKLVITGQFTGDDAAEGEYTVELVGDAPAGCSASVSGTWTASK